MYFNKLCISAHFFLTPYQKTFNNKINSLKHFKQFFIKVYKSCKMIFFQHLILFDKKLFIKVKFNKKKVPQLNTYMHLWSVICTYGNNFELSLDIKMYITQMYIHYIKTISRY